MTGKQLYNRFMGKWEFVDNKPSLWGHPSSKCWKRMIRKAKKAERRFAMRQQLNSER